MSGRKVLKVMGKPFVKSHRAQLYRQSVTFNCGLEIDPCNREPVQGTEKKSGAVKLWEVKQQAGSSFLK